MACDTRFQRLSALGFSMVALAAFGPGNTRADDTYTAYAPPSMWGKEVPIKGHLSAVTYHVKAEPVGNVPTHIDILAEYVDEHGQVVTKKFFGDVAIFRTGNFAAQPKLRFRATPTGCQLRVTVAP